MKNRFFDEREDALFSKSVLEFNSLDSNSDTIRYMELENKIRERTSILLYLIPMRNLYLKEEEAGEFFLDIQKDIDMIISSFRISGLTFNGYLTQICRYRVMRFSRRKFHEKQLETMYMMAESVSNEEMKEMIIPYLSLDEDVSEMNLSEISRYIIKHQSQKLAVTNNMERKVSEMLRRPVKRRQFISYLLSLPETETPGFIAGVSRLLRSDISTVARFYTLRHEILRESNSRLVDNLEMIAGRHWKVMMKMRRAIWMETDVEAKDNLIEKYEKLSEIYNKRRNEIAKAKAGMTHKAIAEVLGISRSSVTYDIHSMRKTLEWIKESI